jgi:urease accessory protein
MPLTASLLLLADSRLPAGGHAHSGGVEAAIVAGLIGPGGGLDGFLRGRLATAGLAAAGLAAAACAHAAEVAAGAPARWEVLGAEAAARTPSPAQRATAQAQGRALLRAARLAWPHPVLDSLSASASPASHGPAAPFHPVVLGACTWITGGTPADAAMLAATAAITGPASAAIRLLGLDPLAVTGLLARYDADVAAVAAAAAGAATRGEWAALPAPSAPGLDLLAERHAREEVALFES